LSPTPSSVRKNKSKRKKRGEKKKEKKRREEMKKKGGEKIKKKEKKRDCFERIRENLKRGAQKPPRRFFHFLFLLHSCLICFFFFAFSFFLLRACRARYRAACGDLGVAAKPAVLRAVAGAHDARGGPALSAGAVAVWEVKPQLSRRRKKKKNMTWIWNTVESYCSRAHSLVFN
jgi:hypothetical protein